MQITAEKKNCKFRIVFEYTDLNEKQSIERAKKHIKELMKKRPWGWKYKVKT